MRVAALVASVGSVSDGLRYLRSRDPLEQMVMEVIAEQAAELQEVRNGEGFARAWNGAG